MDNATKTVMMATLTALLAMAPAVAADDVGGEEDTDQACQPVWVDSQGQVHVDPTCIGPVLDNRR